MEYQCKPFTTSSLISAFKELSSTAKTKTKKNVKPAKKRERKTKSLHFDIRDFSSSSGNNSTMSRKNKLIFCTSSLTIGCENCFMNEL